MNYYYLELTDTFGGELNYSWVRRYKIKANSILGAVRKLSKETGYNFRNNGLYYKVSGACIAAIEIESEGQDLDELYTFEEL